MRDCTIVFDLDGTLVDTAPDIIRAANHVLGLVGVPEAADAELRPMISSGSRVMLAERLKTAGRPATDGELDRLFEELFTYYSLNIAVDSRPFPSMPETLRELGSRGARLAVCTNKREAPARLLLREFGLADAFAAIAGVDTYAYCKPDPRHLLSVIEAAGGRPDRAVMVGDSDTDVSTAKAAGVPVVAVTFGYPDPRFPIADLGAEAVIDHYDALIPALERLLGR